MRKLICVFLLWFMFSGLCAFAATPAKPYPDVVTGDTLTAAWLMGTVNTIYTWAQGNNASMAIVLSGTTYGTPVTASVTTAIATTTTTLIWTSTGLGYVSMVGSGTYGFELDVVAVATGGTDLGKFRLDGSIYNNATQTLQMGTANKVAWRTADTWDVNVSVAAPGRLVVIASSPANVSWKARLISHELDY